jgi:betaine-aldehyde dehydrogenase
MVGFTGSSDTGKRIMEMGSCNIKRMSLELGGKNPFIVFDDADIDSAVRCAVHSSFFNSGQVCASPGRYYLHKNIHDEFVEKFTAATRKVVVGNPEDPKTQMGPLVSKEQRDKVEEYIHSGVKEGAKLVLGGKRPVIPPLNKGYYVMPTIFTGITLDMKIGREEIFGPVACIMEPFTSETALIASVNDNNFGLGGSVWSKNVTKAMRLVGEIQAGTLWINEHMMMPEGVPWGIGHQYGLQGLEEYTQLKVVYVNLSESKERSWNEWSEM